ncbi:UNVERIFIED_ORG: hypothetical protein QE446_002065 [Rhizobium sp. SORGH_AS260]|jgi:hypothetical protein|uniref:hypothetical protein n=1 Tax=Agrobacterium TaxID=357 RepID=UPI0005ED94F6|nr:MULTISPECIES: hypothetical protein [Agrobacterium]MBB2907238.1 hypothetical protein [Rhizobium sp. RAS22]MDP9733982.1 hypothetical protein [Rhizobium sp. SORGH_AS_0285]MDP9754189.1 hypothetical protein [Rhizobium sp. SORGH_AS_0260]MBA8801682.1 hypothetical protein [Agrobacterium sp. RC10-4-1]MCJ2875588.1 hypothetical protein [Agrobacterium pusense]
MRDILKNDIDDARVASAGVDTQDIINPATGPVASRLRAAQVILNGAQARSCGAFALVKSNPVTAAARLGEFEEYLETKAIVGGR